MLLNAIHHIFDGFGQPFYGIHVQFTPFVFLYIVHQQATFQVVQLWPPLDKVCGSLANSNTDSEVQELKAAISK